MKTKNEIVRIKEIYKIEYFKVFCVFTNEEFRYVDFSELFKLWDVKETDPEYKLINITDFQKFKLVNGTLSWQNILVSLIDEHGKEKKYPFEIDPIVLYQNSKIDLEKVLENFGMLLRNERIKSGLTTKQLAKKSGISEAYISKLENEKSNIELLMIRDILQSGFGKRLKINIE